MKTQKQQKPLMGICPGCNNIFEHAKREGKRKIYCSSESMGRKFVKEVLNKLVDQSIFEDDARGDEDDKKTD